MLRRSLLATLAVAATAVSLAPHAAAQTRVFGYDIRGGRVFQSQLPGFVSQFTTLQPLAREIYALDLDASGSVLHAIDNVTRRIHTIDRATGVISSTSTPLTGLAVLAGDRISGLSAHAMGESYALSVLFGNRTDLYLGDVTTGAFSFLGSIQGESLIDIAFDRDGVLYGLSITNGFLFRITTAPFSVSSVAQIDGQIDFAQGMDFNWSSNVLYAALYQGGGVGRLVAINATTGATSTVAQTTPLDVELEICIERGGDGPFGTPYCTAQPNSTGALGATSIRGSALVLDDRATLHATALPNASFGFFIASPVQDLVPNPSGSQGDLCLGGEIGRYVGPGQIQNTMNGGAFSLPIVFSAIPGPNGPRVGASGETWNFQAWHRDTVGGSATSNFTRPLAVVLY